MLHVIALCLFGLLVSTTTAAQGAERYISPTGVDTGDCTNAAAPCKTFAFFIPKLQPGDIGTILGTTGTTYSVAAGTGLPDINCASGAANGTVSARITLRSLYERQPKLLGTGLTHVISVANCAYWDIVGNYVHQVDNFNASPSVTQGGGINVSFSNNIMVRRNLSYGVNRAENITNIQMVATTDSLMEENECYFYHRKCGSFGSTGGVNSERNIMRRNYGHSRGADDICTASWQSGEPHDANNCRGFTGGQSSTRGDEGFTVGYPGSNNIAENNIAEDHYNAFACASALGTATGNKCLGNIAIDSSYAYLVVSRGEGTDRTPIDTILANNYAEVSGSVGVYARGARNTQITNMTLLGGSNQGITADHVVNDAATCDSTQVACGDGTSSTHVKNSIVTGFTSTGVNIVTSLQEGGWSVDRTNAFGNTPNFSPSSHANLTNALTTDPQLGTCKLWVPASSPRKNAGTCTQAMKDRGECPTVGGTADIGANILYRYQNGVLTSERLWDATTGAFPAGAIVAGINDVAGQSLFDVHTRLNVNTGGCSFPSGYATVANVNSALKPYIDSEWTTNKGSFDSAASSGSGAQYVNLRFAMTGWTSLYQAYADSDYLDRVLAYAEVMISKATNTDNCGKKSWTGTYTATIGSCSWTNAATFLEEGAAATEMSRAVYLIKTDTSLNAIYGPRADAVRSFLHTHVVQKWMVDRQQETQVLGLSFSDKHPTWIQIITHLDMAGLTNTTIRTGLTYRQFAVALLNDYMANVSAPAGPIATAGAEIWWYRGYPPLALNPETYCGSSPNTVSPCSEDTSHANLRPLALQRAVDAGYSPLVNAAPTGSTLAQHVVKLERLFSQIIWNRSNVDPRFTNYVDGANHHYLTSAPWVNGIVAMGWGWVTHHQKDGTTAMQAMFDCVVASCSSPSRQFNGGSIWTKTALAGTTALAQSRLVVGLSPDPAIKTFIDQEWTDHQTDFNSAASLGKGATYYYFQYPLAGWLAAYEAYGDITYLTRVLGYAETMITKATNIDTCGRKGWVGTYTITSPINGCTWTNASFWLEEIQGATEMARVAYLIKRDTQLNTTYGSRADAVLAFLHTSIMQKWLIHRSQETQVRTLEFSDKTALTLNIAVSMAASGYANTELRAGLTYDQLILIIINDYLGQVSAPAGPIATAGAELPHYLFFPQGVSATTSAATYCGSSPNTVSPCSHDTSHFNRWPMAFQRAVDAGYSPRAGTTPTGSTLAQHMVKLERLFSQIIWDKSLTVPQFTNYIDGANHYYRTDPPWRAGFVGVGWPWVAHYHQDARNALDAMLDCVKVDCGSLSRPYHSGSFWTPTALAGGLALAQKRSGVTLPDPDAPPIDIPSPNFSKAPVVDRPTVVDRPPVVDRPLVQP